MPYWCERIGVPRTLAVEFPFGQTLGRAGDEAMQLRVLRRALGALAEAPEPGWIAHAKARWPEPVEGAIKAWQPAEPSPIIDELRPRFREILRLRRGKRPSGREDPAN
jgi:hypothetical protein